MININGWLFRLVHCRDRVGFLPDQEQQEARDRLQAAQRRFELLVPLGRVHVLAVVLAHVFEAQAAKRAVALVLAGFDAAVVPFDEDENHSVLNHRDDVRHVCQYFDDLQVQDVDALVRVAGAHDEFLVDLHLAQEVRLLLQQARDFGHLVLAVDGLVEVVDGHGGQLFADRQNRELDREQVVVHRDLDVADVLLEEVERQLVLEVLEVLHERARVVDERDDLQHQDGDVEALCEDQRLGLVLGIVLVADHFEDLVLGHLLDVFLELHPAERVEDAPQALEEDRELAGLLDLQREVVVAVALEQRGQQDHDFRVERDQLRVVALDVLLLEVLLLAHDEYDVAHVVDHLLLDERELVFLVWPLDGLDHGRDDLDAELEVALVEDLDVAPEQFGHVLDDVHGLAGVLAAQLVLQLVVVVLAEQLQEAQHADHNHHRHFGRGVVLLGRLLEHVVLACFGVHVFVVAQQRLFQERVDPRHLELRDQLEVDLDHVDQDVHEHVFFAAFRFFAKPALDDFISGLQQADREFETLVLHNDFVVVDQHFEDHVAST